MKKKSIAFLNVLFLLLGTVSCSSSGKPGGTPAYREAAEKAYANRDRVSVQTESYTYNDDDITRTFSYGADDYGTMALSLYEDPYGTSIDFYKHLSNGKLIAVVSYDNAESWMNSEAREEYLEGLEFDYGEGCFGAEDLILAVATTGNCQVIEGAPKGSYSIEAMSEYEDEYNRRLVVGDVTFTLNADDALDNATITLSEYVKYTDNKDGTFTPKGKPTVNTYSITNAFGTRMSEDPYDIERFYATSWTMNQDGKALRDGDVIEAMSGTDDPLVFSFSDVLPETANLEADSPLFHIYQDGTEREDCFSYYWDGEEYFYYSSLDAGDYELVAESTLYAIHLTLRLAPCEPASFDLTTYTQDLDGFTEREYSFGVPGGSIFQGTTYADIPVYLEVTTNPIAAGGDVIPVYENDNLKVEKATITYWGMEHETLKFTCSVPGTYSVTLVNEDYQDGIFMTYELTVLEAPDLSDVLSVDYVASNDSGLAFEVHFAPDSEDPRTGEVTIADHETEWGYDASGSKVIRVHTNTYSYVYDEESFLFTLTMKSGDDQNNTAWAVPALALSSRYYPCISSNAEGNSAFYECAPDTPKARTVNCSYVYGDASFEVSDVSALVTYDVSFTREGVSLTFRDYRHASWELDEDEEGRYVNVDRYYFSSKDGYTLLESGSGYKIVADFESTYCSVDENPLKDADIFQSLTLSGDLKTLTIKAASGFYTLNLVY